MGRSSTPEKWGKWDREKWVFRPIFLPFFSHFPQPHPTTTLHNPHPVCYARYYPIPSHPPPPYPPRCFSISPHFPHFPHFLDPKSWFGESVSPVAVSADAWPFVFSVKDSPPWWWVWANGCRFAGPPPLANHQHRQSPSGTGQLRLRPGMRSNVCLSHWPPNVCLSHWPQQAEEKRGMPPEHCPRGTLCPGDTMPLNYYAPATLCLRNTMSPEHYAHVFFPLL